MTTFDERERGYEAKFAHDEELRFKATSRRDKLFGQWAAHELGLTDAEAADYARSVLRADLASPGDDDIVHKVSEDFRLKGVSHGDGDIRKKLAEFMAEAILQIEAGH